MWHYVERGSGRPLVLLHGIGMSHAAWNAVIPHLSQTRRVIAFDIAGFGLTPPLAPGVRPSIHNLVDGLEQSLLHAGIDAPVDMAGNSLGGGMALDAARRGIARSVVAISPIGLWGRCPPLHVGPLFGSLRFMTRNFSESLKAAVRMAWLRELILAVPLSAGSRNMPAGDAARAVADLAGSPAFEETFDSTGTPFRGAGVTVPVTVAFGDRDWILPKWSRVRGGLPGHTTWIEMRGWGHVPMWVDPAGVAYLILQGTT